MCHIKALYKCHPLSPSPLISAYTMLFQRLDGCCVLGEDTVLYCVNVVNQSVSSRAALATNMAYHPGYGVKQSNIITTIKIVKIIIIKKNTVFSNVILHVVFFFSGILNTYYSIERPCGFALTMGQSDRRLSWVNSCVIASCVVCVICCFWFPNQCKKQVCLGNLSCTTLAYTVPAGVQMMALKYG